MMELKEYFQIINKNIKLFLIVPIVIVLANLAYFFVFRSVSYDVSLTLNISRAGSQETNEYKYDDFYRLQADEKFSETVVQWLRSPRIASDIYAFAGVDVSRFTFRQLGKGIRGEKLSSQVVAVSFSSEDRQKAEKMSQAVLKIIADNADRLNKNQKESTWFEIIPQEPIIKKYSPGVLLSFFAPLLFGIFLGFWTVMIKHYLK
jgi:capsular polysaccharide biosynthesis protein